MCPGAVLSTCKLNKIIPCLGFLGFPLIKYQCNIPPIGTRWWFHGLKADHKFSLNPQWRPKKIKTTYSDTFHLFATSHVSHVTNTRGQTIRWFLETEPATSYTYNTRTHNSIYFLDLLRIFFSQSISRSGHSRT